MLNSKAAKKQLSKDPLMKQVIKEVDYLQLQGASNVFNELVKGIAYQQISYKAADTIYGRFLKLVGGDLFSPQELLILPEEEIRGIGFSRQKANYVHNIARFFEEKDLFVFEWKTLSDSEIIKLLTEIKGVGEWTVQMVLIFELQRPDVFPEKDLGVQQAMMGVYDFQLEKKALIEHMRVLSAEWAPHRTLASLYLWAWKRLHP